MSNQSQITRRTLLGMGSAAAAAYSLRAFAEPPQAPATSTLKVEKDVVVGKAGDKDLLADVYRPPAGLEKRMALIHLHGGGFSQGSKDTMGPQLTPITMRGYVSIALAYRLSGEAKWPAQMEDVKNVIRWTRANASSLGIEPNRITVVGYSAGGLLALVAAGTADTQVAACVAFYPVSEPSLSDPWTPGLLGPGADAAALASASPMTYIKAGYPPTIVYHGLADTTVPPDDSLRLLQELRTAGGPCELHTFAGVAHVFDSNPEFAQICAPLTDFFLDRYILNPRKYPAGPGGGRPPASR